MHTRHIRNFSIVAHIDHGKSTLADRLLELTATLDERQMKDQVLDDMQLERSRGITIKARAVVMHYEYEGQVYELNLIDTPGHVDFHYEVSRSLACCEGAVLLVDAFQGVEAQTLANAYAALEHNLALVPVINKIDLAQARPEEVTEEMERTLSVESETILRVSAKTGQGTPELLNAIIECVPPPDGDPAAPLQAMVFDAHYDAYRGSITYIRVMNGTIRKGQKIRFLRGGTTHEVLEVGQFTPGRQPCERLCAGQVGYLIGNIKSIEQVHIGDTVSTPDAQAQPLAGYREPQRMVYCGLYPSDGQDFDQLREALGRLSVNDPSFEFEPETSEALGFGFRCGFLGLLHMEIIQQRLEQESDIDLVQTAPNVTYQVVTQRGERREIHRPQEVPDAGEIAEFHQPIVRVDLICPSDYIGPIMQLCIDRRGVHVRTEYLSATRAMLTYDMPLAEVIYDLHDRLKSATRGYGTMDYDLKGYAPADLVRLDILVNGGRVDALSIICDRRDADRRGRAVVKKLKTEIDRHMFEVAIQAAVGSRVIARETVPALRKNVTAKCYGGDITRKRKLWAKQREGKKRMKSIGQVDIPQKAFLAVLSKDEGGRGKNVMAKSSPRIAYLTAGAAGMYCGSCLHDNTLARELHRMGVDIHLIPTYTPIRTDEENAAIDRVFYGGINVYLEQKFPLFQYLPSMLTSWLDRPGILRWAASRGIETDARQLGALTVSMLRGRQGNQRKELQKLVAWLHSELKPDMVVLTNSMLSGCLPAIKESLRVPALVNLQGDDAFLDYLVEPHRSQVLGQTRHLMQQADGFLVNSRYYAEHMAEYLDIETDRMHYVPLGIDVSDFPQADEEPLASEDQPPTVGYLARLTPAKGLDVLVDAFMQLRQQKQMSGARLQIAGWLGKSDQAYAEQQFDKLRAAGLDQAFSYVGTVDRQEKIDFLRGLDVLSVPAIYREPKGLYVLEALAAGVPVVQPAHGAFPELLAATGGGRLTTPNDPAALAATLAKLLADRAGCRALGRAGREVVFREFNAQAMARQTLDVYRSFLSP